MQTKLAVINCKSQKQDYKCSAEEMYMKSYVHRTQVEFIKEYYDDYVILSAKEGVVYPNDIIEPYSVILHTSSTSKALTNPSKKTIMYTKEQTKKWASYIMDHPIFTQYDHVDFHLPNAYWNPISGYVPNICKSWFRVSYPQSLITTGHRYEQLLNDFKSTGIVDLNMMGVKIKSDYPEQLRWHYHRDYPPFYGWARNLVKQYPELKLDEGALTRVDKVSTAGERYSHAAIHHKGWVCDESNLQYMHQNEKGTWQFKK